MIYLVWQKRTDVSKEHAASIFRCDSDNFVNFYKVHVIILHRTVIFTVTDCGNWARRGVVVKALRYKPAGREFDSLWCNWNFSVK